MYCTEEWGPEREEIPDDWKKLQNEEIHDLCLSPNIQLTKPRRKMCMQHACGRSAYKFLVVNSQGKSSFGRHRN
jgi:hypothetical protein